MRFGFQTLASFSLTLWHASDSVHGLFHDNMEILAPLEAVYRYAYFDFLGVKNRYFDSRLWLRTTMIAALYLIVYAGALLRLHRWRDGYETGVALLFLFCICIHFYAIAVSSLIEFGENNRFRFPVDGVFTILLAGNIKAFLTLLRLKKKTN